jgi:hypothetical protein
VKHLLIGVSLATLTIATPAIAGGRYIFYQCTPNQNIENWFLIFDTQTGITNFSKAGQDKPRYGTYVAADGITLVTVSNDTSSPIDLKLRPNHSPTGKPVLEWTSGSIRSTMLCEYMYDRDIMPVNWTLPPWVQPDVAPPVVADTEPVYVPIIPAEPDVKVIIPPTATAYAPEPIAPSPEPIAPSSGLIVPLTSDGMGGHMIDVILGDKPVSMVLDTGASFVQIPEDIAYPLLKSGGGSIVGMVNATIADGSQHSEPKMIIFKLIIGGKILYNVEASISPSGSMSLLGTNVLNQFGKYSVDAKNNQLILG